MTSHAVYSTVSHLTAGRVWSQFSSLGL